MEIQGEWWLPEEAEHRLKGTLTIEPDRIELALFDAFGQSKTPHGLSVGDDSRSFSRILGEGANKAYTLDRCFQTNRTGLFGGMSTQRVTVHQVFEEVHFEPGENIEFTEITIKIECLAEFVQQTGLDGKIEIAHEQGKETKAKAWMTLNSIPMRTFPGLNGSRGSLEHTIESSSTEFRERHLTEDFVFRIKYTDLRPPEQLLKEISHLRDLVTIATGRRAAYIKVSYKHPDVAHHLSETDKRLIPITQYAQWTVRSETGKRALARHDVLFTLEEFGGPDALGRWLEVADANAASLSRVMVARYSDGTYITDNLLNAVAALEGYDREKYQDGKTLLQRLRRCASDAGSEFGDLVGDVKEVTKLLKNSRNDIAHHNAGIEGTMTDVFVARVAGWLLILCLMRDAKAPDVVFEKIAKHPQWLWLKARLAEVLADPASSKP